MPSQRLERLSSQMLEHSLQKISVFSFGQTTNSKAKLDKPCSLLRLYMLSVLLTCINDEPSGIVFSFCLLRLCRFNCQRGTLTCIGGGMIRRPSMFLLLCNTDQVRKTRNKYSTVRRNSISSKHHFHGACPRVVTIISTATTSNFSTNF